MVPAAESTPSAPFADLGLALSPHRAFHLDRRGEPPFPVAPAPAARIEKAFSASPARGLLHLATVELASDLPPSLAFGRDLARSFLTALCKLDDPEPRRARHPPAARRAPRPRRRRSADARRPIVIEGRAIAKTFWGKAWCDNLEAYSDFENRLPRGRTYVRDGSVVDIAIARGKVSALVQGSSMYEVDIGIGAVDAPRWKEVVAACAGRIDSVVELLRGRLSSAVMAVITHKQTGLFPSPKQIRMTCSCPDWATMCKHVAAVLYGVGARLDDRPELLFELRGVDAADLVTSAAKGGVLGGAVAVEKVLDASDLGSVFGIDLEAPSMEPPKAKAARGRAAPGPEKAAPRAVERPGPSADRAAKRSTTPRARAANPANGAPRAAARRTDSEFRELGVPEETVAYWVRIGALEPAGSGAYRETPLAQERLGRCRARA